MAGDRVSEGKSDNKYLTNNQLFYKKSYITACKKFQQLNQAEQEDWCKNCGCTGGCDLCNPDVKHVSDDFIINDIDGVECSFNDKLAGALYEMLYEAATHRYLGELKKQLTANHIYTYHRYATPSGYVPLVRLIFPKQDWINIRNICKKICRDPYIMKWCTHGKRFQKVVEQIDIQLEKY